MIGFKIILVGVALCALVGCGQKDCREEGAISGMIRDLSIRPVAGFSGVYDSVTQICDRIEKSANVADKGSNYKALATRLANIDFTGLGGNDRTFVFSDYWRSLALVCSKMAADDSLDKEKMVADFKAESDFRYLPATIVKMSRNSHRNYFIIDKGYEDGVTPQSGVVTSSGIVGIIDAVDKHYSYGLSFMNTGVNISTRLGTEGAVGPLTWDGMSKDGAILKELPLQYKFEKGDTVWTSGYSSLFPADIPLGVTGESKVVNGAVNEISIKLFQDFSTLKYVTVVANSGREEITYLENLEGGEEQP